jgi:hypothetical protein
VNVEGCCIGGIRANTARRIASSPSFSAALRAFTVWAMATANPMTAAITLPIGPMAPSACMPPPNAASLSACSTASSSPRREGMTKFFITSSTALP